MKFLRILAFCWATACVTTATAAPIRVVDDLGRVIELPKPAQRIITLAPHLTESLFAVGGGGQIVGAVEFSDYPEAAKSIPRVGGYSQINLEALIARSPDLILAWHSGNSASLKGLLEPLGIPVYYSEPDRFDLIASTLERLGTLSGNDAEAQAAAMRFRSELATLEEANRNKPPVRVFFEVWAEPLMTINGEHLISQVIELCGGDNLFAKAPALVPRVGMEGVISADPEVILSGDKSSPHGSGTAELRARWQKWDTLTAVRRDQIFTINGELILRHTPRILRGAQQLCLRLDEVRAQRSLGTSE